MNNKIKILGLSAFIATGMVPIGAKQILAKEINPTQVEERNLEIDEDYDIDDNLEDVDENEDIDDSEIIPINDYVEDYQSDNNQEQKDNQEDINENKDIENFTDFISRYYKGNVDNYDMVKYKQSDEIIKDIDSYINNLLSTIKFNNKLEYDNFIEIDTEELNNMLNYKYNRFPLFERIKEMSKRIASNN